MLHYMSGDVYLNEETNIIFNPVGVRDNSYGFLKKVNVLYPTVYEKYKEQVYTCSEKELMGDIQIVEIPGKRVVLNGFCKNKRGTINKIALVKILVELYNLAYEYNLSIGIEYALGVANYKERKILSTIIKEVFGDMENGHVYIYDRKRCNS